MRGCLKWDAGRLGQGAPACCGLQLTHSASCHGCAGAGMPASCLGGSGSLYPCTCQSRTLCQGCWAEEPAARHARTRGGGYSHRLPLGSPNGGWRKHVTVVVQLTITSRTGSSLPVCFSILLDHPGRTCHLAIRFIHRWTREALEPSAVLQY